MNTWLILIILIILSGYAFESIISYLNLKALRQPLPEEFRETYNNDDYVKSQVYTRTKTQLNGISTTITTIITLLFLFIGGFNYVDLFSRSFEYGTIITGLIFSGSLILLTYLINLPFSIYSTFVIEERFGFNRTTPITFLLDTLKASLLLLFIGAPLLALILWFFESTGNLAWILCWIGVVLFSILIQFLAPVLILPLFNTFTPLENGELKNKISGYAKDEAFTIQGIFTMDGSKRSSKLNAFFTGFGRFRKIVFYDTLLEKLTNEEIIAVLAHEMGHFKLNHIIKMMFASILQTGLMFYLLSCILNNKELFEAFGMSYVSIYASLIFFTFLYSPVNMVVSVLFNHLSRKHEFEADLYAAKSTGESHHLVSGLKKLTQANLSNLTPHPIVVLLQYTHPPVLFRIEALKKFRPGK